ncbi:MAG: phospholipase D-like domain-containing protein [Candidatus Anammoxibacter sp.]
MNKIVSLKIFVNAVVFSFFLLTGVTFAEDLNFLSPGEDVNFHIKRAIDRSSNSIDMAIVDVKSREIAEALVHARKRGVAVRILFSKKKLIGDNSQLKHLLNNGIKAWILEDERVNVDNFAIFDKRILLVGSFHLDQNKFQNITFTNDKDSIQQYQGRFDGFAGLHLSPAENIFSLNHQGKSWEQEQRLSNANAYSSSEMVGLSFEDMNRLFGKGSALGRSEKKRKWKEYKGRYVTWSGNISYVAWGLITGDVIGVTHTGGNEVVVNIKDEYANHVKRLHKGDPVTYSGKVVKRPSRFTGFKVRDAEILTR